MKLTLMLSHYVECVRHEVRRLFLPQQNLFLQKPCLFSVTNLYSFHKVTLNHSSFVEERSTTDIPLLRTLNKGFEVIRMPTAIDWGNIGNHFSFDKFFLIQNDMFINGFYCLTLQLYCFTINFNLLTFVDLRSF